ncbi:DUF4142 domain-containing protein [Deinococcus maricopensis]|uniref:DUF4142 domain-containing protein n=1 Tax=Deinococcus maricopensis (strain DSM 21211 / LMG 22137 / NRRL B-23946 / LB-34) TaxID=709986 RepID=E8U8X7_DEIML|nr:DUF4142 domain-containing protein [Deinococcus maricopensis]ADV67516.1 hypothetical protein Deima_1869 [Deinococcus maricopensis DSM 21211]
MKKHALFLLAPLTLAACAPMMMAPNATTVDGLYMQAAAGGNLFEIQSSQVALKNSTSDAVRAFAQQMIADHTTAQNQLTALAAARGVPLPTQLPPELQLKVTSLSGLTGAAFDAAYAQEQVVSHQLNLSVQQNELTAGKDADVRAYAQAQVPIIQQHLEHARTLPGATAAPATP